MFTLVAEPPLIALGFEIHQAETLLPHHFLFFAQFSSAYIFK
jgi:hypothetical protein